MIDLKQTPAFATARLPVMLEGCDLRALPPARITALAPYPGQMAAVGGHLGGFPDPGGVVTAGNLRLVWAGRDLVFAFGTGLPDSVEAFCAVTDQSDGWAGLALQGPGAEALLARHLPFDLRRLPAPGAARSLLGHVPALIMRTQTHAFEIWVWRSMARSALHELGAGA